MTCFSLFADDDVLMNDGRQQDSKDVKKKMIFYLKTSPLLFLFLSLFRYLVWNNEGGDWRLYRLG
jgi:hypothetical protein